MKKCINCGNSPIANFRGYPVYIDIWQTFFQSFRPQLIAILLLAAPSAQYPAGAGNLEIIMLQLLQTTNQFASVYKI